MLWWLLTACAPSPFEDGLDLGPRCPESPCVANVAAATYESGEGVAWTGYALATSNDVLVIGAPDAERQTSSPRALALALPSFAPLGAWRGSPDDLTGLALAATDLGGGGIVDVAIGSPASNGGGVHLVHGLPDAEVNLADTARLTFLPPKGSAAAGVLFADVLGDEEVELLVATNNLQAGTGALYALDPGEYDTVTAADALRILEAPTGLWSSVAAWDGTGLGMAGPVVADANGVFWFEAPWAAGTELADARASWLDADALSHGLGLQVRADGDLDGDGLQDLLLSAATHDNPVYRAGRAYVALAGWPVGGSPDELPIQVRGTQEGDAMGFSMASGDIDGDGQDDLVVGAPVVYGAPRPGTVHVFLGPVSPGVLGPSHADAVVFGERNGDFLGRDLTVVPGVGDHHSIVMSATAWPAGEGRGAVYLVEGSALFD